MSLINFLIFIMNKGTVKFFNDAKGFGFITEEGNNKEHFVHISGLIDEIRTSDDFLSEAATEADLYGLTFKRRKSLSERLLGGAESLLRR